MKLNIVIARTGGTEEEVAEAPSAAGRNVTQALAQLRFVVSGIAPPVLFENGLVAAVEGLAVHSGMEVSIREDGVSGFGPIGGTTTLLAYHCTVEGLINATRHGHADRADITPVVQIPRKTLVPHLGTPTVAVRGNGEGLEKPTGVDAANVVKYGSGAGVVGLYERTAALGGTVTPTNTDGGAQLLLGLPIRQGRTR